MNTFKQIRIGDGLGFRGSHGGRENRCRDDGGYVLHFAFFLPFFLPSLSFFYLYHGQNGGNVAIDNNLTNVSKLIVRDGQQLVLDVTAWERVTIGLSRRLCEPDIEVLLV